MEKLLESLEEVKRTKAALEKATEAMHKASAEHQAAVKTASELHRDFNASVAELIPSIRIAKAG